MFVDNTGNMYKGEWLDDKYHGKGIECWNNNTIVYTGDFVEGKKTGFGKFEFDGNYYEGDFEDGQFDGEGEYYFIESGKKYKGAFQDNQINGIGVMTFSDGSSYEGTFLDGKPDGKGVKRMPNGNIFEGTWKMGIKHGKGKFYSAKEGTWTPQEWRDGQKWQWSKAETSPQTGFKKVNTLLQAKSRMQNREEGWAR